MAMSADDYLNALLASVQLPCPLTVKAREALRLGFDAARAQSVSPVDDAFLYGLLRGRTAALPVFDNADVDVVKFADALSANLGGAYGEQNDFESDIRFNLTDTHFRNHCQSFRIMAFAKYMARSRSMTAIDSGLILEAVLRQSLYADIPTDDDALAPLCDISIVEQIRRQAEKWHDWDVYKNSDSLPDILNDLSWSSFVGEALVKMSRFVPSLTSLDNLENTLRFTRNVEPYFDGEPLIVVSDGVRTRIRHFSYFNSYRFGDTDDSPACKVSTFVGSGFLTWDDVMELERLINHSDVTEHDIQVWMEKHPALLLGTDYDCLHSQVSLLGESGDELIPDFFAQRFDTGMADIIELKKPNAPIITGKDRRRGFSAALTQALNQVREYRNYFDNPRNRKEFHGKFGFDALRPAVSVVIGRSRDFCNPVERIQIEDEYRNLRLVTYDDILRRAKRIAIVT